MAKSHQWCKVLPFGVFQRHKPGCVPVFLSWYRYLRLVKLRQITLRGYQLLSVYLKTLTFVVNVVGI